LGRQNGSFSREIACQQNTFVQQRHLEEVNGRTGPGRPGQVNRAQQGRHEILASSAFDDFQITHEHLM
jgi:hypothetical protein